MSDEPRRLLESSSSGLERSILEAAGYERTPENVRRSVRRAVELSLTGGAATLAATTLSAEASAAQAAGITPPLGTPYATNASGSASAGQTSAAASAKASLPVASASKVTASASAIKTGWLGGMSTLVKSASLVKLGVTTFAVGGGTYLGLSALSSPEQALQPDPVVVAVAQTDARRMGDAPSLSQRHFKPGRDQAQPAVLPNAPRLAQAEGATEPPFETTIAEAASPSRSRRSAVIDYESLPLDPESPSARETDEERLASPPAHREVVEYDSLPLDIEESEIEESEEIPLRTLRGRTQSSPRAAVHRGSKSRGRSQVTKADVPKTPSSLREELKALAEVRSRLRSGLPSAALTLLRRYSEKYPEGVLKPEAALLKARAERALRLH